MRSSKRQSWTIAFCGMAAALAVVCMLLGAVIPIAMFIGPALAGLLIAFVEVECGRRMALTAYLAVSILSFFLVPDREVSLYFVLLLGYYPLIKPRFDRIKLAVPRALAKLCLCNGAVAVIYALVLLLFPMEQMESEAQTAALVIAAITLVIGNIAFLLYDKALVNLIRAYRLIWQPRLYKMLGIR